MSDAHEHEDGHHRFVFAFLTEPSALVEAGRNDEVATGIPANAWDRLLTATRVLVHIVLGAAETERL